MSIAAALRAIGWLIRDTFRQAQASGIVWVMLGISAVCVALCLSATVTGESLELAFGAVHFPLDQGRAFAVRSLEVGLAGWVADGAGLLLALLWTAGFLPTFLEPGAVAVLLVKPVPRWALLAGKFGGVLVFVAVQASLFVGATWLALGLRTGVWDSTYFLSVPLLLLHFAVFFSFSAMLAVATRSTAASVLGSVVFWLVCLAMNFGRHASHVLNELRDLSPALSQTLEVGYWVLPKPLDFHFILLDSLHAENPFHGLVDFQVLAQQGAWSPALSVMASVLCGVVLLAMAAYDFLTVEY